MPTSPTPTTTTATNGIQARSNTVLPTERGLTRSPLGIRFQAARSHSVPDFRARAGKTPAHEREHQVCGRYHLLVQPAALRAHSPTRRESTKPATPRYDVQTYFATSNAAGSTIARCSGRCDDSSHAGCCFKTFSPDAFSTLRC